MLFIYLKNNKALEGVVKWQGTEAIPYIGGNMVRDYGCVPYIDMQTDDFAILKENQDIPQFFLKATSVSFPDFTRKTFDGARQYGVYRLGDAKAELQPSQTERYWLKLETSSWGGIADMQKLRERLWAGTITPTVAYGNKQRKIHILDVLTEILNSRKLNKLQRFFLALRLTKPKSVELQQ